MTTTLLSPAPKFQAIDANGNPLVGGKLFTYIAGTTTKVNTFTNSGGVTPNTNPIILDANGECDLWLTQTQLYKMVLAPSTDTDPPTNPIWTVDNVNELPTAAIIASILAANNTWTGTNAFTDGITVSGAPLTISEEVINEAFATIASATTTNIGAAAANYLQVTGTTTITAFDSVQAGAERTLEFAGAVPLTHNATSLILSNGASFTTQAGDVIKFRSEGSGNWRQVTPDTRIATKTQMQVATDLVAIVTPSQIINNIGVAKVIVDIAADASIPGINLGVSTCTVASTSFYTVTFSKAFTSTSFVALAICEGGKNVAQISSKTTTTVVVETFNPANGADTASAFCLTCYGTQ